MRINSVFIFMFLFLSFERVSFAITAEEHYEKGLSVFSSLEWKAAVRNFQSAAGGGHPEALFALGVLEESGLGIPKNVTGAASWYTSAAQRGHAEASFRLATMYETGYGVEQSFTAAIHYYKVALFREFEPARQRLIDLQEKLERAAGNAVAVPPQHH